MMEKNEAEEIAKEIRENGTWNDEPLRKLCSLAGMEDEYNQADGETFEEVVQRAADKLGVEII